jgi:hypothetical protein
MAIICKNYIAGQWLYAFRRINPRYNRSTFMEIRPFNYTNRGSRRHSKANPLTHSIYASHATLGAGRVDSHKIDDITESLQWNRTMRRVEMR